MSLVIYCEISGRMHPWTNCTLIACWSSILTGFFVWQVRPFTFSEKAKSAALVLLSWQIVGLQAIVDFCGTGGQPHGLWEIVPNIQCLGSIKLFKNCTIIIILWMKENVTKVNKIVYLYDITFFLKKKYIIRGVAWNLVLSFTIAAIIICSLGVNVVVLNWKDLIVLYSRKDKSVGEKVGK